MTKKNQNSPANNTSLAEQNALAITLLREALKKLSAQILTKAGKATQPLDPYDGKGKLFEAYITFALRRELLARNAEVEICASDGTNRDWFLLRGNPGRLKETVASVDDEPCYLRITGSSGKVVELHNSVGWPDHHVNTDLVHEMDLSVADEKTFRALAGFTEKPEKSLKPLIGIEAKFRGRKADKSLGRELTGLAYGVQPKNLILVSSIPPRNSVIEQMKAIPKLGNNAKTKPRDLAFFPLRLVGDETIFSNLADVVIKEAGLSEKGFASAFLRKRNKSQKQS